MRCSWENLKNSLSWLSWYNCNLYQSGLVNSTVPPITSWLFPYFKSKAKLNMKFLTSPKYFSHIFFRIRETYHAADINSNSGKIWSTTAAFPCQLFSNTKFNINICIDNSTQRLHFKPYGKRPCKINIKIYTKLIGCTALSPQTESIKRSIIKC